MQQIIDDRTAGDIEQHFGSMTSEDIEHLVDGRPDFEAYGDWYQNLFDDEAEAQPAASVQRTETVHIRVQITCMVVENPNFVGEYVDLSSVHLAHRR